MAKKLTAKKLAKVAFEPVPQADLKRMNAQLAQAEWDGVQKDFHDTMVFCFALLAKSKEELLEIAATDDGVDTLIRLADTFRAKAAWLKSAVQFTESADIRIMTALAVVERQLAKKAA